GPPKRLPPAEPARHVNVSRKVTLTAAKIFANRTHARRIGVARVLVGLRHLIAGVGGCTRLPSYGRSTTRRAEVLTDLNAGHVGGDRLEFAPHLRWGVWLQIEHILGRCSTQKIE